VIWERLRHGVGQSTQESTHLKLEASPFLLQCRDANALGLCPKRIGRSFAKMLAGSRNRQLARRRGAAMDASCLMDTRVVRRLELPPCHESGIGLIALCVEL